jgi:hypothetical protein
MPRALSSRLNVIKAFYHEKLADKTPSGKFGRKAWPNQGVVLIPSPFEDYPAIYMVGFVKNKKANTLKVFASEIPPEVIGQDLRDQIIPKFDTLDLNCLDRLAWMENLDPTL